MRELSLNLLDIAENSVKAGAKLIQIGVICDENEDYLELTVSDNGKGMNEEFLKTVVDPFTTTRTTRNVGMGIPLFKQSAEEAGGVFEINSKENVGTKVKTTYQLSHIDRMPLGDVAGTLVTLINSNPEIDFEFNFSYNGESFVFKTKEVKEVLEDVPINNQSVIEYVKELITENVNNIHKGEI